MSRGLGAFAQGFGGAVQAGADRKERRDMLAALQSAPVAAPVGVLTSAPTRFAGARGATPPPPTNSAGGTAATGSGNPFLDLMDRHEGAGDFSTLFGHSQRDGGRFAGVDVSRMTLGQLREFASPNGEYGQWVRGQVGRVATPMGRFQIVGTTLRNSAQQLGYDDNTVFDENTQGSIAMHLARNRLNGVSDPAAQRRGLRSEWEGLRSVSDPDLDRAIAFLQSQ